MFLLGIVVYIVGAIWTARLAKQTGRSPAGWVLLSLVITPIGTILLLLTLNDKEPLEYTPQQLKLKWILGSIILLYIGAMLFSAIFLK